jgi:putative peptidoglycan binding protein
MPATLRLGSFGSEVKQLQQSLNLLPTQLQRLAADGSFGPKTHGRAVEFQKQSALVPDGIVGPFTWARLLELIAQLVPPGTLPPGLDTPPEPADGNGSRADVVNFANGDAIEGGVAAKTSGGKDSTNGRTFRMGHHKLLKYFRLAAPNVFNEDAIQYLTTPGQLAPCPHWCGIFALWAVKSANVPVGTWKIGSGISSVSGFKQISKSNAQPGDVGYVHHPFQHHFIIKEVGAGGSLVTVEGNSGADSRLTIGTSRTLNTIDAVYSPFPQ